MLNLIIEYIFWDWHGVLGNNGFWDSYKDDEQVKKFTDYAFSSQNQIDKWMRNQVSLSQLVELSRAQLTTQKITRMLIDELLKDNAINTGYFKNIKAKYPASQHVLTTDNMDVFNAFLHQSHFIKQNFVVTLNSCNFGRLKKDTPSLFELAKNKLSLKKFDHTLLIDDSENNCKKFIDLGGNAMLFKRGGL